MGKLRYYFFFFLPLNLPVQKGNTPANTNGYISKSVNWAWMCLMIFFRICLQKIILFNEGDWILMILSLQSLNNLNYANFLHLITMMKFLAAQLLLKYN